MPNPTPKKITPKKAAPKKTIKKATKKTLLDIVLTTLEKNKAVDCTTIPLAGKTSLADYMVVVCGTSARHVVSICENLQEQLKQQAALAPRIEGKANGDWILVDAGDIIVHIFRAEVRAFYQLEKMWQGPAGAATPANLESPNSKTSPFAEDEPLTETAD